MLTDKQQRVLDVITEFIQFKGESPTLDELQELLDFKSKHSVVQFLESLDKKWYISRGRGYRSIRLWERIIASQLTIPIPILGIANAGKPLVYAQESDLWKLLVSRNIIRGDESAYFFVRVDGTSMNTFSINGKSLVDGSYALIDKSQQSFDGNPLAAYLCIVNNCATLKHIKKEWNNVYLIPDSTDKQHQPIILTEDDSFLINGKVVDVFNFQL
jgi:repressor LexA